MTQSIIPQNRLKRLLQQNQPAVGTMLVEIRQPSIMQVLSNAGFDFVIIDGEHGPFSIETIADLSRAAKQANVTPIVRVPEITYTAITQSLDAGAQGIMIPRVTEPKHVESALQYMKYPPLGKRGSVLARGHTEFKVGDLRNALKTLNDESMLIVQIETKEAAENLDAILSIEGVDAALVGPTDLTVAFNKHGNFGDPQIKSTIENVVTSCRKHGVIPAIHMNELDDALAWAANGMRMVSFNSEIGLLTMTGRQSTASLRNAFTM